MRRLIPTEAIPQGQRLFGSYRATFGAIAPLLCRKSGVHPPPRRRVSWLEPRWMTRRFLHFYRTQDSTGRWDGKLVDAVMSKANTGPERPRSESLSIKCRR